MISLIYHSCIDTSNQAFQKAVICRQLVKYWLQRMAEISYSGLAIDLLSKNCSITCEIVTRDKVILICSSINYRPQNYCLGLIWVKGFHFPIHCLSVICFFFDICGMTDDLKTFISAIAVPFGV